MPIDSSILRFGIKLLFEGVGRETPAQQRAVGYYSLSVVNEGCTVDSSRGIEAEYRIYALVVQPLAELRPAGTPLHFIRNLSP